MNFEPTTVFEDNLGALKWGLSDRRTKHVDIRHHFVRDMVQNKHIVLEYCPTNMMLADLLTKTLSKTRFLTLRNEYVACGTSECVGKGENVKPCGYADDKDENFADARL